MPSVHDVAKAIIQRTGPITAMKLEKLVYYAQAWSLVWDESPLFPEKIQAWAGGPVVPALYYEHKGMFQVDHWRTGDADNLSKVQIETIESVIGYYGKMTAQALSDLTHREEPWIQARKGLAALERGNNEIGHASMAEYYGSL